MSFILDWIYDFLYSLGLWKKEATVLLLGLDNAGKTTLLYKLKEGKLRRFTPTQRPGVETVEIGNVQLKAWDLGGHKAVRDIWEDYYTEANAIIFMLDLSDDTRLEEAREALQSVLAQSKHVPMKDMVLLVLGNKCDKPTLLQIEDVERFFNLDEARTVVKAVGLFRVSLYTGAGLSEALKWLENALP